MARIVQTSSQVALPPYCVFCLAPADKMYKIDRTFSYGRASQTVEVEIPLCAEHYRVATHKNPAEILVGRIGFWLGVLAGVATGGGLLIYWFVHRQGTPLLNIPIALAIGTGFFLILWSSSIFWLAPQFADPQSRQVRESVRILHFWPGDDLLELEFQNERAAHLVEGGAPPPP
jgi:hypothetical protein